MQWIQSAEVAKTGKTFYQLFDRTYHLAAIHAAPQVGRAQPTVTEWVQAARVATITDRLTYQLFDLTTHLAAIHAAPQELWPVFVEALLAQDWTDRRSAKKPAGYPAAF